MAELFQGWQGLALIAAIAVLVHEPWRWLGAGLAQSLSVDSELFQWVKAVSTALVSALVMRLVLFPPEGLGVLSLETRLLGLACSALVFFVLGRNVMVSVLAGGFALFALGFVLG